MIDEGYIKYRQHWIQTAPFSEQICKELALARQWAFEAGLIGFDPVQNVGYGNISQRTQKGFLISGTQTGDFPQLNGSHFCHVDRYNLDTNELWCQGPIKASSEALTHAVVYAQDEYCQAVIHVHSRDLWERLLHQIPTTDDNVPYGTPEMAYEVMRLFLGNEIHRVNAFAMAGHQDGIVTFGNSLEAAWKVLQGLISQDAED
ncbi:MAG: class II aldolase/adducin family protein [Bacteroidota bacterium]